MGSTLGSLYPWVIMAYDRLYRRWHGLDCPRAYVPPILCIEVHLNLWHRCLSDGTIIRPGDRVGMLHLDNRRVVALHGNGVHPGAIGLAFRRDFLASLRRLGALAGPDGPLSSVTAFTAVTLFHRGLRRLGFEPDRDGLMWPRLTAAYQRALLATLHPGGPARVTPLAARHAERLWLSRRRLLERYGESRADHLAARSR